MRAITLSCNKTLGELKRATKEALELIASGCNKTLGELKLGCQLKKDVLSLPCCNKTLGELKPFFKIVTNQSAYVVAIRL